MPRRRWQQYKALLQGRWGLPVKMASAFCIGGTADAIAQSVESARGLRERGWDARRTLTWAVAIGCIHAPLFHWWLPIIDGLVATPPATAATAQRLLASTKKACIGGVTMGPVWLTIVNIYKTAASGRWAWSEMAHDWRERFPSALLASWFIIGPSQVINFTYVPMHLRVLWMNCVALLWNTVLSCIVCGPQ
eukprot:TRINITY_DN30320_c0_g1_i1.p3 TRINITY_DN30320_c0_g1~~TRINITY_DN30320_c0_g1_i1.p3  ORF type:complete len:217 (+),score=67.27 TRINITY_DN30320_c0_g1_i1:78-653(+)